MKKDAIPVEFWELQARVAEQTSTHHPTQAINGGNARSGYGHCILCNPAVQRCQLQHTNAPTCSPMLVPNSLKPSRHLSGCWSK